MVDQYQEKADKIKQDVESFVTNYHFNTDERWILLTNYDFGKRGWYTVFDSLEQLFGRAVDWIKDFGLQRHCIIDVKDIHTQLLEKGYSEKELEPFRNEATVKFIRSFKHDW